MKNPFKVLLPMLIASRYTVEDVHKEFDSAEDRILDECDSMLAELKIPTETQIERKAKMMEKLGFVNSETVHQAKILKEKTEQLVRKSHLTSKQATLIREYKQKYPLDKFITVDELNRICRKYNLIHAPASNYIKDIPEKNILELINGKKLDPQDSPGVISIVTKITFLHDHTRKYINFVNDLLLNKPIPFPHRNITEESLATLCKNFKGKRGHRYYFKDASVENKDMSGLFIAAPPSHFDLKGTSKRTKNGYFNITSYEVKDPVAFEYCNSDICRIRTKWGTDDDQSYLDPLLVNSEVEN